MAVMHHTISTNVRSSDLVNAAAAVRRVRHDEQRGIFGVPVSFGVGFSEPAKLVP